MIKQAIEKLVDGQDLSYEEAKAAMLEIMTGQATNAQIAGYLTALRIKGETIDEITASAQTMRDTCVANDIPSDSMDIVGTGGDKSYSFNISTASSFVVAAGGVKVAKHGNKSVSSKCGAANVLEACGANLRTSSEKAKEIFEKCGFVFLHAQVYHPAMRYAGPVRGELGIRTVFNVLGPLGNPAKAEYQLLGVYSHEMVRPLCEVLAKLGAKHVIAVHGEDGLDEVSCSDRTFCCEYKDGKFEEYYVSPADFGLPQHRKEEIVGGEPEVNAKILKGILDGEKSAYRDIVVMNSALCLCIAGKAATPEAGARLAEELIDSGKAKATFEAYVAATNA